MEEVRQLVQEEGREARNLVAFHVSVDSPSRVSRKPPRSTTAPAKRVPLRSAARLRSASAGRDKRSELRARYWALLFGDLQRAIGEIYNTVEAHENLNECHEVILVLENYTRDFKALGEWFRLKWEYDNTPPPQRPQSLAWEIRKTDFVRPESRRAFSVKTSPTVSGKNSPSLSGHNTPSGKNSPVTGKASPASGKISPRIVTHSSTSPKGNIEFFSNKIASKLATKPEAKVAKETRLSDIKEKDFRNDIDEINEHKATEDQKTTEVPTEDYGKPLPIIEIGKVKEISNVCPKQVIIKSPKHDIKKPDEISIQAKTTISLLDAMESEFLAKNLTDSASKNDNMLNRDREQEKKESVSTETKEDCSPERPDEKTSSSELHDTSESPVKSDDNFADVSNESSLSNSCNEKHAQSAAVISSIKSNVSLDINDVRADVFHDSEDTVKKSDVKIDIVKEPIDEISSNELSVDNQASKTTEDSTKASNKTEDNTEESKTEDRAKESKTADEITNESKTADEITNESKTIDDSTKDSKTIEESKTVEEGSKQQEQKKEVLSKEAADKKPEIKSMDKEKPKRELLRRRESLKDITEKKIVGDSRRITKEDHDKDDSKKKEDIKESGDKKCEVTDSKKNLKEPDKDESKKEEPKKTDSKVISDTKVNSRPAYSQAAAKPKPASAKVEVKAPVRSATTIARSKNVVETTGTVPKLRQFPKKNQTSKCSYPFNLTTGRSSLFDSTPSTAKPPLKKPLLKPNLVGSGDTKNVPTNKIEPKKRPLRPSSLKVNEKGDKKEKVASTLEKIKDCDEYSSSDTIVTQINMSRIDSSESLKTLVPEEMQIDSADSVEVLNLDGIKNDNEGWLTVKSRRLSRESKKQSKSHWANRFHQPSATTSLPTLNMISPKQETNPIEENVIKSNRATSEQPERRKYEKPKPSTRAKTIYKTEDPAMIRQKSDVTGLKSRSIKDKMIKKSEDKDKEESETEAELTKNRLHSSLESLTTGLARSQESTENTFDFDKWKAEFKSTFKFLDEEDQVTNDDDNEILKSANPSEMSEIAEVTEQIEENERKICLALDFQTDVDQRKLCEEEDLLNRQIMELQQVSDIDLDTETDDTETDAEILCDDHATSVPPSCSSPEELGSLAATLEDQYETALAGMSWAERVDTLVALQALVARDPGRAQQLHAKLSQGIKRRGSLQDALRRLQAKQARAERHRQELQTERSKKIHQLLARVEEVKIAKNQLIEEKRLRMERRLQKAAENRDQHLKDIVRKAHDEDEKLREILFIKQLEAENRRHELLDHCRETGQRLRAVRRDRLNKLQQKAEREAAVGLRRQALEAARQAHVQTMLEKRRERDRRREERREERRRERDDAAREKAEGVKSRLSALAAAAELEAVALRVRIRHKQDASQQRLESRLQAIREKANRQPTTSESHEHGSKEENEIQDEAERQENERRERDRLKNIKKKARKVRQKLLATSTETPAITDASTPIEPNPITNKFYKVVHQLNNILTPLLDNEHNKDNGNNANNGKKQDIDNDGDVERNNKKNKKLNKADGLENGLPEKKKSKKKKNGEDKTVTNKEIVDNTNNKNETPNCDSKSNNIDTNIENKNIIENIIIDNTKDSELAIDNITDNRKFDENAVQKNTVPEELKENIAAEVLNTENRAESNISLVTGSIKSEGRKRKKKNRDKEDRERNDRPKLSKASSICSELSETSRASKGDRASVSVDVSCVEKQLNEIDRMMEKLEKSGSEKCVSEQNAALRVAGNVLAVGALRDDLVALVTNRCISRCVSLWQRLSAQRRVRSMALGGCAVVHALTVLAQIMEKELQAESREVELAKQLCCWVECCLQGVVDASRAGDGGDDAALAASRARGHNIVSYICLSGCVARAENAPAVRDAFHRLLTVCIELCQPCDVDVGPDRSSAVQSLRSALGRSICGARASLCELLAGESAGREAQAASLLRAAAELDLRIVQEAFGEGGWPLEFRAAVARLLAQHAPTDREAPRSDHRGSSEAQERSQSEAMVLDLIVLVGFVVVNNPVLQETICDGWSVIKTLCTLPANWLVTGRYSHAALPTLAALAERPQVAAVIAGEMSLQLIEEYLESPEAQKVKLVQVIKQGRSKKTSNKK